MPDIDHLTPDDVDAAVEAAADRIAAALTARPGPGADDAALVSSLAPQIAAGMVDLIAPLQASHAAQVELIKSLEATVRQMAVQSAPAAPTRPAAPDGDILRLAAGNANPDAIGAQLDGRYNGFGDFVRAVYRRDNDRLMRIPQSGNVEAALDGEELPDGGALVPEEFRAALMRPTLMPTSIRSRATVLPMGSASLDVPYLRDTSHAGGVIYGGIQTYWLEAGETMTMSEPEFAQVHLVPKNLVAGCVVRNTMLADSFASVPALLGMLYPEALRRAEERTFLRGDGAGKPLGIFNSPALIDVTRDTDAANLSAGDVHAMEGRLMPGSEMRAVWMIHPGLRPDLGKLNLGGVQYWQEDLSMPRPMTLNGRPVILSEFCSAPGTAGDMVLADWMYYLIGDRQAMSLAVSGHARFEELATVFRFNERVDGQPWIDSDLTLEQGGAENSVSPFVRLA